MKRDNFPAKTFYGFLEKFVLPGVKLAGWTPDQFTVAGLLINVSAGVVFAMQPPLGALIMLVGGLCDVLDGLVARHTQQITKAGAFFDSVLDRYAEIFVLAGCLAYLIKTGHDLMLGALSVFFAMTGSLMVSYTRARGEGLGFQCQSGLFQRTERVLILAAGGFLEAPFPGSLLFTIIILATGSNLTAIKRMLAIRKGLKQQNR